MRKVLVLFDECFLYKRLNSVYNYSNYYLIKNMKRLLISFAILGILFAFPSHAAEYYMDSEIGNDASGCGEVTSPCQTFVYVLTNEAWTGGDKFYFRGSFVGDDIGHVFQMEISGTIDNYTEFAGWPGEEPAVFDAEETERMQGIYLDRSSYVKIHNLHFINAASRAIGLFGTDNIELYDLSIYDNDNTGILITNEASDIRIHNNSFYGHGINATAIMIDEGSDIQIEHNSFYDNNKCISANYGITGTNNTVKNNIFYMIEGNDVVFKDDSLRFGVDYPTLLTDSDIDSNLYYIVDNEGPNSVDVVCYDNAPGSSSSTDCYKSVDIWQDSGFEQDALSFEADPQFISLTSGSTDLHIQQSSPAIDAGLSIYSVTDDMDGEERPYGIASDIGADELPQPGVATDEQVTGIGTTSAIISWTSPDNTEITSYEIDYALDEQGTGAVSISDILDTSVELTDLTPGTTYYFGVTSYYDSVYDLYASTQQLQGTFETMSITLKKVKNLKVKKKLRKKKNITVTWKKHNNITVLKLQKWNKNIKKYKKYKTYRVKKNKKKKLINKLKPDTKYRVCVRKRRKIDGEFYYSNWTSWIKFKTQV